MKELAIVFLACLAALVAITVMVSMRAREAAQSGELRYWGKAMPRAQVIRRDDNPQRFSIELKILRVVPWIGFALMGLAILVMGAFL